MRYRNAIIAALILAVVIGLIHWKNVRQVPRKYVVAKKQARPVETKKKAALPAVTKTHGAPKVVVVMDDFGYSKNNIAAFFAIREPITLSILPGQRYSKEVATEALSRGYETILHLPLEAKPPKSGKVVTEEADTIKVGMGESEVLEKLAKQLAAVPGISGVSNHQGSLATENVPLMTIILKKLKRQGLFFFDSLTSEDSVCGNVARKVGIRYARRDIFLDNSSDPRDIEKQVLEFRKLAFAKGRAIAVCHDRKNTVAVLARMLPEMAAEGIDFMRLADVEN